MMYFSEFINELIGYDEQNICLTFDQISWLINYPPIFSDMLQ